MNLITNIINLTQDIYNVDVSNNVKLKGNQIVLYSDDYFDWFAEGVIIYQPEYEAEKGVSYKPVGTSTIYEYENLKNLPKLYIRSDYHQIISKYYKNYCLRDVENPMKSADEYDYISFVIILNGC